MGVPYDKASSQLTEAAEKLFAADPRVRSVGIGQHPGRVRLHSGEEFSDDPAGERER